MARDKETFLSRWSRRKLEEASAPAAPAPAPEKPEAATPPELPPLDKLGFDSDYQGFLHPKVDEALRRQALKKLFASPHFQTPDMMDDFNEDYTLLEALAPGEAEKLAHAKRTLFGGDPEAPATLAEETADGAPREQAAQDAPAPIAQAEDATPTEAPDGKDKDQADDGARG